jgi:hypothetical protein
MNRSCGRKNIKAEPIKLALKYIKAEVKILD